MYGTCARCGLDNVLLRHRPDSERYDRPDVCSDCRYELQAERRRKHLKPTFEPYPGLVPARDGWTYVADIDGETMRSPDYDVLVAGGAREEAIRVWTWDPDETDGGAKPKMVADGGRDGWGPNANPHDEDHTWWTDDGLVVRGHRVTVTCDCDTEMEFDHLYGAQNEFAQFVCASDACDYKLGFVPMPADPAKWELFSVEEGTPVFIGEQDQRYDYTVPLVEDGPTFRITSPSFDYDGRNDADHEVLADGGVSWTDLNAFQRDTLDAIYQMESVGDQPYGLAIKSVLDEVYDDDINHGRLYRNLDELRDMALIEKTPLDRRTYEYALTFEAEVLVRRQTRHLADTCGWTVQNTATDGGEVQ